MHSYRAILHGDRLQWCGDSPSTAEPLNVTVTIVEQEDTQTAAERRKRMVAALEEIAARGGIKSIPDPVAWQREIRTDRALPGREE